MVSSAGDEDEQIDWPLDPNQHHFYLVDEGDHESFGVEIEFLSKLNHSFCEGNSNFNMRCNIGFKKRERCR